MEDATGLGGLGSKPLWVIGGPGRRVLRGRLLRDYPQSTGLLRAQEPRVMKYYPRSTSYVIRYAVSVADSGTKERRF